MSILTQSSAAGEHQSRLASAPLTRDPNPRLSDGQHRDAALVLVEPKRTRAAISCRPLACFHFFQYPPALIERVQNRLIEEARKRYGLKKRPREIEAGLLWRAVPLAVADDFARHLASVLVGICLVAGLEEWPEDLPLIKYINRLGRATDPPPSSTVKKASDHRRHSVIEATPKFVLRSISHVDRAGNEIAGQSTSLNSTLSTLKGERHEQP